jgi:hypothetical protein
MFPLVVKVLEYVEEGGKDAYKQRQANGVVKYFETFATYDDDYLSFNKWAIQNFSNKGPRYC